MMENEMLQSRALAIYIQWDPSKPATLGTSENVPIRGEGWPHFRGEFVLI